jgi:hypothetical protein
MVGLAAGNLLMLSQVVVQFSGGEPNLAFITAAFGLITGVAVFNFGDRRNGNHVAK